MAQAIAEALKPLLTEIGTKIDALAEKVHAIAAHHRPARTRPHPSARPCQHARPRNPHLRSCRQARRRNT